MKKIIFPLILLASCLILPGYAKGRDDKCNCGTKCGCDGSNQSEDCSCHNQCDCRDGKKTSISSLPDNLLEDDQAGDEMNDIE